MTKISILLPTRGRTTQLLRSVDSLIDNANDAKSIQWLFGFDNDDLETYKWFQEHVLPKVMTSGAKYTCMGFDPQGYENLHNYVNKLASKATGDWFVFWNDDAVMKTPGWDTEIVSHTGTFCLQAFDTHNKHPYSIFPIVPKEWYKIIGHLSLHQLNDAWLSQIAWVLDIVVRLNSQVDHNRYDLTGENFDDTYRARKIFEGNPQDPKDFNSVNNRKLRLGEAAKLAAYLKEKEFNLDHWEQSVSGKVDPWSKMLASDINGHLIQQS